jgi:hypothetical protein
VKLAPNVTAAKTKSAQGSKATSWASSQVPPVTTAAMKPIEPHRRIGP